jgi:protein TBF1
MKGGRVSTVGDQQMPQQGQLESNFSVMPLPISGPPPPPPQPPPRIEKTTDLPKEDFVARAARAAKIALQGHESPEPHTVHHPPPPQPHAHSHNVPQPQFQQAQIQPTFQQYIPPSQSSANSSRSNNSPNYGPLPEVPHVSQSAPTQELYARARMAASAKASPTSRRSGLPSQRRPWTTEEENALMAGLDRVRGPHWSQILAMFGPGGTVNESLKDRNQVQLKDKARNLKLFFLKGGIEVPYYLKYVTGDLKTRAPAQASKNEARERERQQGEEDKAHFDGVQGIMALAGAPAQYSGEPGSMDLPEDAPSFEMLTPPNQDQMSLPLLDSNVDPNLSDMQMPSAPDQRNQTSEHKAAETLKTDKSQGDAL